jgi:hypothetical protein
VTSTGLTDRTGSKKLRKFGLVMAGAFTVVSLLIILRGTGAWPYTAGLAGFFLVTGLFLPAVLRPVERVWMKFAAVLGFVMTNVILTVAFFIGVTTTGLVMRLFGKDPLSLRFEKDRESYWREVEPDGPCSRPDKPY